MPPQPEQISAAGLCTGCGACVSVVARPDFSMTLAAGYYRPKTAAPLTEAQTKLVGEVCAGINLAHDHGDGRPYDPLWGPVLRLATGHALDPEVRFRGSSGGVISALAIALLESGRVDAVLATSADEEDPIGNRTALRRNRAEVLAAAGSRYAPSTPLAEIERHLASGLRFAFVGKPCDVAALRRMAARDPRIDRQIPFMLSFFCAGVPNRLGTVGVLDALGVTQNDVAAFRYRGEGWPGLARATRKDGTSETMDYNSSWGTILNRHLQFRCKICPDGIGEFADIACADAWYGEDGYPDFGERDGRSLIVARTAAGQALLAELEAGGALATGPLDRAEIEKMQPYQANRKRNALARVTALRAAGRIAPRFRRMGLVRLAFGGSIYQQARNFLGTFKRAVGKREA